MEKIPYKPGDVLVDKLYNQKLVVDLSKNGYVAHLSSFDQINTFSWSMTKEQLDLNGYTLKTPKEEDEYYFYISDDGFISDSRQDNLFNDYYQHDVIDKFRLKSGNRFRTREEAEEKLKEILNRNI